MHPHQRAKSMASGNLGPRNANQVMMRPERQPVTLRKNYGSKGGNLGENYPIGSSVTPAPYLSESAGIGAQGQAPLKQLLAMKHKNVSRGTGGQFTNTSLGL